MPPKNIADKVFYIRSAPNDGSGGTGWAVNAPSGAHYIVTNAHVCEGVLEETKDGRFVWVSSERYGPVKKKVLNISDNTDLCLIEGFKKIEGLAIAESFEVNEHLRSFGHPLLMPISGSEGVIRGIMDITVKDFEYDLLNMDRKCDLPKQFIQTFDPPEGEPPPLFFTGKVCLIIIHNAYATTLTGRPGSSGSPALNDDNEVVGVVFAVNSEHSAFMIPLSDIQEFLRPF